MQYKLAHNQYYYVIVSIEQFPSTAYLSMNFALMFHAWVGQLIMIKMIKSNILENN